jgi:hypothetical protein
MKRGTINSIYCLFYLSLVFLFWGCATPKAIISLNEGDSSQLLQKPIGVIVFVPGKSVSLTENLYRVFWIENNYTDYTFEGVWDPSIILRDNLVKTFQEKTFHEKSKLTTIPLWEKLEPDVYNKLVEESEIAFNKAQKEVNEQNNCQCPPYSYLKAKHSEGILSLRDALGVDYLLELYQNSISIWHHPPLTIMFVGAYGRLVRLSDGAIIWLDSGTGNYRLDDFNNFSELEKNNFELLKKYYELTVNNLFNKDTMRAAPLENPYDFYIFKELFPK